MTVFRRRGEFLGFVIQQIEDRHRDINDDGLSFACIVSLMRIVPGSQHFELRRWYFFRILRSSSVIRLLLASLVSA